MRRAGLPASPRIGGGQSERASGCPARAGRSERRGRGATSRRSRPAHPGCRASRRRRWRARAVRRAPAPPTVPRRRTAAQGTARGSARSTPRTAALRGSLRADPSTGRRAPPRSLRGPRDHAVDGSASDLRSPTRRAPDRDQDLDPALLCAADEIVEVVEPIRGIEGVRSARRPGRSRVLPHHDRPQDGRTASRAPSSIAARSAPQRKLGSSCRPTSRRPGIASCGSTIGSDPPPRSTTASPIASAALAMPSSASRTAWPGSTRVDRPARADVRAPTFAHPTSARPRSAKSRRCVCARRSRESCRRSGFRDDTQDAPQRARARRSCTRGLRRQPVPATGRTLLAATHELEVAAALRADARRVGTPRPARAPRHALTAPLLRERRLTCIDITRYMLIDTNATAPPPVPLLDAVDCCAR